MSITDKLKAIADEAAKRWPDDDAKHSAFIDGALFALAELADKREPDPKPNDAASA